MNFLFEKYRGAGNDFIIIDDRKEYFPDKEINLIKKLCDRNFGIGADGRFRIRQLDFKMLYFNADGYPSSLCSNGSRCVFAFSKKHKIIKVEVLSKHQMEYTMLLILTMVLFALRWVMYLKLKKGVMLYLWMQGLLIIEFVDEVSAIDVKDKGAAIRYGAPYFEAGSNANFVEK